MIRTTVSRDTLDAFVKWLEAERGEALYDGQRQAVVDAINLWHESFSRMMLTELDKVEQGLRQMLSNRKEASHV